MKKWSLQLLMLALLASIVAVPLFAQVLFVEKFDSNPTLSATQASNAWYVDRYAPNAFESVVFAGGNRLRHGISVLDAALSRPSGQQGAFYNTQGRKFDLNNPVNTSITADLYVGADWQTSHRRADMWATMSDGASVSAYPIIGFANSTGSNPTWRVWDNAGAGGWIDLPNPAGFTYGAWYTLKTELTATAMNYYINGVLVYTGPTFGSTSFLNIIIQAYNFGDPTLTGGQYALESYDVYWDNIGAISNIHNETKDTYHVSIQDAVTQASAGNLIRVGAGTYTEALTIDKALTLLGANANVNPNTGVRGAETIIDETPIATDGSTNLQLIQITSTGKVVINGFKFVDNEITATGMRHLLYIPTTASHEIKYNIFSRAASASPSGDPRAVTITPSATGIITVDQNLFVGSSTADLYNNKGWKRGVWSDGGGITTTVTNNVFKWCRSAMNLDTFTANAVISGNTFQENGTAMSFGLVAAGTYTIAGNAFVNAPPSTVFNLSGGIDPAAFFDATGNTYDGKLTSAMTQDELFTLEYRIVHGLNPTKNGFVMVKANNVYVVPFVSGLKTGSIQTGLGFASNGWTVNVAAGTYGQSILVNKSVSILGAQAGVLAKGRVGAESIVDPNSSTAHGFKIVTDNVTIDGFSITNSADYPGAGERYGVVTIEKASSGNFSNIVVKNNHIQRQFKAVAFNGTDNFTIEGNWLHGESAAYNYGSMWIDDYGTSSTMGVIRNNDLEGYSSAVEIQGDPAHPVSGVTITNNRSTGSQYVIIGLQNSTVSRNSILNVTTGSHVYVDGGSSNVTFSENFIDVGTSNGFSIQNAFGAGPSSNLTISANSITGHTAAGKYEIIIGAGAYTGDLNASGNWFGTTAAASRINGSVDYTPWLSNGTDADAVTPGFQPTYNELYVSGLCPQTGVVARIAEGLGLLTGNILHIMDGVYTENVTVNRSLSLLGAGAGVATINGNGAGNCISVAADNVTISGLTLTNGHNGIQGETKNSVISNCVIQGNKNFVSNTGVGICLWGDNDNNLLQGNTVYNNDRQGIFVGYGDATKISVGNRILNNTIHHNGLFTLAGLPDASSYGIQLWHADQSLIQGNAIYNQTNTITATFGGIGVYLINSQQNSVIGNTIHDNNVNVAIWNGGARAARNNLIQGNTLTAPTWWSIRTYSDAATTHANFNVFSSSPVNSKYVRNGDVNTLDATYNWFDGQNPPATGAGTGIDGLVDITGFYATDPTVSIMPASYYMGVGTTVHVAVMGLLPVGTLVKGSDITLNWSNNASIRPVADPMEGDFFSKSGGQSFFDLATSPGAAVRVNQSVLDQSGVGNASGLLPYVGVFYTMTFEAVSGGASAITLDPVVLRNPGNGAITTHIDPHTGITLTADGSAPVVAVTIDNQTLSSNAWVKNGDAIRVTANVTDGNPLTASDIVGNLSGFYATDHTADNPASYASPLATWPVVTAAACNPSDGSITVTVTATDMAGNVGTGTATITADNTKPAAIAGFTAAPGKAKTHLNWTNPGTGDATLKGVRVQYAKWDAYPHYVSPAAPGFPATSGAGDGTAADVDKSVFSTTHTFPTLPERGIYYYRAFAYDNAGNFSVADGSNGDADRSTNYVLGDLGKGSGSIPGSMGYDGRVDGQDLFWFSAAYFSKETDVPAWAGVVNGAEVDFGPTVAKKGETAGSRLAIPQPDNKIEFEDLMIFSMNYQQLFLKVAPAANSALAQEFSMGLTSRMANAEELVATIHLSNDGRRVKGAAAELSFDPAMLAVSGIDKGDLFGGEGQGFYGYRKFEGNVRIEASVLGAGTTVEQSGDVATVHFRVLKSGDPKLVLADASVRNATNASQQVTLKSQAVELPTTFDLSQNYPNPFNPTTVIKYQVPAPVAVEVAVYNVLGEKVATLVNEMQAAGYYTIEWNGRDSRNTPVSTGMYIYTMKAGEFASVKKMMMVK